MDTTTYENPSLKQIYEFLMKNYDLISEYEQEIFNKNNFHVVEKYLFNTTTQTLFSLISLNNENIKIQADQAKETFFLGGQILLSTDEPITDELIQRTQSLIDKTDYSQLFNMELYSVQEHIERFDSFKKLYYNYKEFHTHKKYSPGNIGYQEAKQHYDELTSKY